MFAGVLDPKTGKATDIPIPVLKPEEPKGSLEIELEPGQKNVWLALMYQAGVARIDRKTHEVQTYPFPKEWDSTTAQASMVSPQHSDVDGKVWTNNQEEHHMYRIDVKTGQYENLGPSKNPAGKQISAYGMPTDKYNNVYQLEFGGTSIGIRDAKTGIATIYQTPIKNSRPRRGRVDEQNRLWFAEFGGNAIGLFDPQTAAIKEYPLPTKFSLPYDVVPNKDASRGLDRIDAERSGGAARHQDRAGHRVSAAAHRPTSGACSCRTTARGRCSGSAATTAPRSSRSSRWTDGLLAGAPIARRRRA